MSNFPSVPPERNRTFVALTRWIFVVVSIVVVVAAAAVFVDYVFRGYEPLIVSQSFLGSDNQFCPGERKAILNKISTSRPIVLRTRISVMDEKAVRNISNTTVMYPDWARPLPASFYQTLVWHVPDLAPGRYMLVITYEAAGLSEEPVFVKNSFTIGRDC